MNNNFTEKDLTFLSNIKDVKCIEIEDWTVDDCNTYYNFVISEDYVDWFSEIKTICHMFQTTEKENTLTIYNVDKNSCVYNAFKHKSMTTNKDMNKDVNKDVIDLMLQGKTKDAVKMMFTGDNEEPLSYCEMRMRYG